MSAIVGCRRRGHLDADGALFAGEGVASDGGIVFVRAGDDNASSGFNGDGIVLNVQGLGQRTFRVDSCNGSFQGDAVLRYLSIRRVETKAGVPIGLAGEDVAKDANAADVGGVAPGAEVISEQGAKASP